MGTYLESLEFIVRWFCLEGIILESVGSELDECSWKRSGSCLVRLQFYLVEFVTGKGSEFKMQ